MPVVQVRPGQPASFVGRPQVAREVVGVDASAIRVGEEPRTSDAFESPLVYMETKSRTHGHGSILSRLRLPRIRFHRFRSYADDSVLPRGQVEVVRGEPNKFFATKTSINQERNHRPQLQVIRESGELLLDLLKGQKADDRSFLTVSFDL